MFTLMQTYKVQIWCWVLLGLSSCVNPPDFPEEPVLTFESLSKSEMLQGDFNEDSLFVLLSFTDGDGDIGRPTTDSTRDIVVFDNRTGKVQERFKMPEVPEDGTGNGIEGEITIRLFNTCCLFPGTFPPCSKVAQYPFDTITYDIYISDRAGHQSNTVTTTAVILRCD